MTSLISDFIRTVLVRPTTFPNPRRDFKHTDALYSDFYLRHISQTPIQRIQTSLTPKSWASECKLSGRRQRSTRSTAKLDRFQFSTHSTSMDECSSSHGSASVSLSNTRSAIHGQNSMANLNFTVIAFWSWYAVPPLLPITMKKDLHLSQNEIANSNIIALTATYVSMTPYIAPTN